MKITELKGVGPTIAAKLKKAHIEYVSQLFIYSPTDISDLADIKYPSVCSLVEKARNALLKDSKKSSFEKGTEIDKIIVEKISTGTDSLDKLFDGGLETGCTTEVYGEYGCGKSQFCHTMAVMVQKELGKKVVWLDSESTFRPKRIRSIAKANGLDEEEALDGITVAKASNSVDQLTILQEIESLLHEEGNDIKLLIIDSATGLFRQEFLGRGTLSERQIYLNRFLTLASRIAETHGIAVLMTNQVMISPGILYGDPVLAVGGTILAHKSTYRVYFRKAGKKRTGIMVDSPGHPQTEVSFQLGEDGVMDIPESPSKEVVTDITEPSKE